MKRYTVTRLAECAKGGVTYEKIRNNDCSLSDIFGFTCHHPISDTNQSEIPRVSYNEPQNWRPATTASEALSLNK